MKIKRYFGRTVAHDRFVEADERHFDLLQKNNADFLENWVQMEGPVDRKLFVHSSLRSKQFGYDNKYNFSPSLKIYDRQMYASTSAGKFSYIEQLNRMGQMRMPVLDESFEKGPNKEDNIF